MCSRWAAIHARPATTLCGARFPLSVGSVRQVLGGCAYIAAVATRHCAYKSGPHAALCTGKQGALVCPVFCLRLVFACAQLCVGSEVVLTVTSGNRSGVRAPALSLKQCCQQEYSKHQLFFKLMYPVKKTNNIQGDDCLECVLQGASGVLRTVSVASGNRSDVRAAAVSLYQLRFIVKTIVFFCPSLFPSEPPTKTQTPNEHRVTDSSNADTVGLHAGCVRGGAHSGRCEWQPQRRARSCPFVR